MEDSITRLRRLYDGYVNDSLIYDCHYEVCHEYHLIYHVICNDTVASDKLLEIFLDFSKRSSEVEIKIVTSWIMLHPNCPEEIKFLFNLSR